MKRKIVTRTHPLRHLHLVNKQFFLVPRLKYYCSSSRKHTLFSCYRFCLSEKKTLSLSKLNFISTFLERTGTELSSQVTGLPLRVIIFCPLQDGGRLLSSTATILKLKLVLGKFQMRALRVSNLGPLTLESPCTATTPTTQFSANTHILLYVYPKFLFCHFLRNKRNSDPNFNLH